MSPPGAPSPRTQVRRAPTRAHYDREEIDAILDEALVCHLGFVQDGQPYVIPTIHARVGDVLYLHGSAASRALRVAAEQPVCVTVTLVDGLVLARSAFHHSMNYRSVVVLGQPEVVEGDELDVAFEAIVEHVVPGRWADARPPNDKERRATTALRLPIDEASAKVRPGGVNDDPEDLDVDVWAGVLPVGLTFGAPEPDTGVTAPPPAYLDGYTRPPTR